MKKIVLHGKHGIGKFALVDDEDFEWLNQWKWHVNGGYVCRSGGADNPIFLHRFIMNPPWTKSVDHKNGNKLDNQKVNLRICNASQNGINRKLQKTTLLAIEA